VPPRLTGAAALALGAVYILWGSTAPAIRVAVASLPPWSMASIRFAIAGTLLVAWSAWRGAARPTRHEWTGAAVTGLFLLVLGNGIFAWCLQYIPGGIGSLFFSLSPLFMAVFAYLLFGERISWQARAGLAVGFGGMAYLVAPAGPGALPVVPSLLALFCSVSWALGSIVQHRFHFRDVVQASGMQMLCASAMLALLALVSHEHLTRAAFTVPAVGAVAFLVVGGSIVGYSCYLWLLRNVPTTLASTYGYVNPIVALAIGVAFLHEPFGTRTAVAACVIVAGVAMMVSAPPAKPSPEGSHGRGWLRQEVRAEMQSGETNVG
jgi:drug/metabolite transporter (DMT)-like permease